jgi:hypothetical protein
MSDFTHISFSSILSEINHLLDSKIKLDEMFKDFTNSLNSLNYYIGLYQRHEIHPQLGKKKFCKNNDDNDDIDDNNNNNYNNTKSIKPYKICPYRETDPKDKKEYLKGKTKLEKHKYLRDYEIQQVIELEAQENKKKEKEKNLEINMNDYLHLDPITTSNNSSDISSTDTPLIINPSNSNTDKKVKKK